MYKFKYLNPPYLYTSILVIIVQSLSKPKLFLYNNSPLLFLNDTGAKPTFSSSFSIQLWNNFN